MSRAPRPRSSNGETSSATRAATSAATIAPASRSRSVGTSAGSEREQRGSRSPHRPSAGPRAAASATASTTRARGRRRPSYPPRHPFEPRLRRAPCADRRPAARPRPRSPPPAAAPARSRGPRPRRPAKLAGVDPDERDPAVRRWRAARAGRRAAGRAASSRPRARARATTTPPSRPIIAATRGGRVGPRRRERLHRRTPVALQRGDPVHLRPCAVQRQHACGGRAGHARAGSSRPRGRPRRSSSRAARRRRPAGSQSSRTTTSSRGASSSSFTISCPRRAVERPVHLAQRLALLVLANRVEVEAARPAQQQPPPVLRVAARLGEERLERGRAAGRRRRRRARAAAPRPARARTGPRSARSARSIS